MILQSNKISFKPISPITVLEKYFTSTLVVSVLAQLFLKPHLNDVLEK